MQVAAIAREPITGVDPAYEESTGGGIGYTLGLLMEYQFAPQLFIGSRLEIEKSRNYEPSRFLVYVRHSLDKAAAQPVPFPPQPFVPTAER